jgi:hypothetical protein
MRTTIEILDQVYRDVITDYNESSETLEVLELIDELQTKLEKLK